MTRAKALPDWTERQLAPIVLSDAARWARRVRSDVLIECGPKLRDGRRETVAALNSESRKVLLALADATKPGADASLIKLDDLRTNTGLSWVRLRWCLDALKEARLIGPWQQAKAGNDIAISVRLKMGDAERGAA